MVLFRSVSLSQKQEGEIHGFVEGQSSAGSNDELMQSLPDALSNIASPEILPIILSLHTLDIELSVEQISYQKGRGGNRKSDEKPMVDHGSVLFTHSKKTASSTHVARPRTWYRTDASSSSLKKSFSIAFPPQRKSEIGKVQGASYIHKGISLVRKPALVVVLPQGLHGLRSFVYRLNPSGVDKMRKRSGVYIQPRIPKQECLVEPQYTED